MKTKKLILYFLILFIASSCWESMPLTYNKLTDIDKQMIPYKLGQTVNFIDSLMQPFVLTVTKDTLFWFAPGDEYYFEKIEVSLKSELNKVSINMDLQASENNYNNAFELYIGIYKVPFYFYFRYNSEGQFYSDTQDNQYYHESIKINNKIYYEVVEKVVNKNYNENGIWVDIPVTMKLLYSKKYGILQLEYKDKILFTINN